MLIQLGAGMTTLNGAQHQLSVRQRVHVLGLAQAGDHWSPSAGNSILGFVAALATN